MECDTAVIKPAFQRGGENGDDGDENADEISQREEETESPAHRLPESGTHDISPCLKQELALQQPTALVIKTVPQDWKSKAPPTIENES